mgnify:CR=1 FL=1
MVPVDSSIVILACWLGGLGLLIWRWPAGPGADRLISKAVALLWLALPVGEPAMRNRSHLFVCSVLVSMAILRQDIEPWVRRTLAGEPTRGNQ